MTGRVGIVYSDGCVSGRVSAHFCRHDRFPIVAKLECWFLGRISPLESTNLRGILEIICICD